MPLSRKSQAVRSPEPDATDTPAQATEVIVTTIPAPHVDMEDDSASRAERYALIYERYPGAPGTALAIARETAERAQQAAKRERARKSAEKAEREHLGINSIGKRRKSSSPFAADSDSEPPRRNAPRARRVPSRQESPSALSEPGNAPAPRPNNAPVNPSPLAVEASKS